MFQLLNNMSNFTYRGQADLGNDVIKAAESDNISLSVNTSDNGSNVYTWYYDGVLMSESSSTYSFQYFGEDGLYECYVTNPGAPDLTLLHNFLVQDETVSTHPDYAALEALFLATDGKNWINTTGWLTDPVISNWHGVFVDGTDRVWALNLLDNNLAGSLPSEIGDFASLQYLDVSGNNIEGEIPSELGSLSNLQELYIENNRIEGNIPSSIGGLSNLLYFWMYSNDLNGSIPSQVGSLSSLIHFYGSINNFDGEIPSGFGNLTSLQFLGLDNNDLSGDVPSSIGNLTSLSDFRLYGNTISGLPNLSGLPLSAFDVSSNALDFGDIVPNVSVLTEYRYQDAIDDPINAAISEGESYTMDVSDLTSGNSYQWYLDGLAINGATNSSYTISSFSAADEGDYWCGITNFQAPDLYLGRRTVSLTLSEASDLIITFSDNEQSSEAEIAENEDRVHPLRV